MKYWILYPWVFHRRQSNGLRVLWQSAITLLRTSLLRRLSFIRRISQTPARVRTRTRAGIDKSLTNTQRVIALFLSLSLSLSHSLSSKLRINSSSRKRVILLMVRQKFNSYVRRLSMRISRGVRNSHWKANQIIRKKRILKLP